MTDQRLNSEGSPGADSGASGERLGSMSATGTSGPAATSVPPQTAQVPSARAGQQTGPYSGDYGTPAEEQGGQGGDLISKVGNMSWMVLSLFALGMIAIGIMLLVWPAASLTVVAVLVGASILVAGFVKFWEGLTGRFESGGHRAGYIVIGLLAIVAGLYCLRHLHLSLFLVAFVTGVFFVAHGFSDIGVAFAARGMPGRGWRGVLGLFSIAAGLILVVWPGITLVLLLTIMAAWLLFYGCMLFVLAFHIRRATRPRAAAAGHGARTATA
jgi:uncharacterized membrane protein HdeD (DUF308 family)